MSVKINLSIIILFSFLLFFLHDTRAGTFYLDDWNTSINVGKSTDAFSVAIDKNSNIIVAGYTSGSPNYWNITKFDKDGNYVWNYAYPFGTSDQAKGVAIGTDNNITVVGYDNIPGNFEWRILKLGSDGTYLWDRSYNFSSGQDQAAGVAMDSDNNITVVGSYNPLNKPNDYGWAILKLDKNGNHIWNITAPFSDGNDVATAVAIDNQNNIIVAGFDNITGIYEWRVMKYDKKGNYMCNYTNNFSSTYNNIPYGVAVDNANNIIVAGYDRVLGSDWRTEVIKLNATCDFVWNYMNNTVAMGIEIVWGVAVDSFNNITVVGYYNASAITASDLGWQIIKLGYDKATLWFYQKNISNRNDQAKAVAIDKNDDSMVAVGSDSLSVSYLEWRIMKFVTCNYNSTRCSQCSYNWTGTKCCGYVNNYTETPPYDNQLCVSNLNKTCQPSTLCNVWSIPSNYFCNTTNEWSSGDGTSFWCNSSLWNGCSGFCNRQRDKYYCNGLSGQSGACTVKSGTDTTPVAAGKICNSTNGNEGNSNQTYYCAVECNNATNCQFNATECKAGGACDDTHTYYTTQYIPSGQVCRGNSLGPPDSSKNCSSPFTCTYPSCNGTRWFRACTGSGSCSSSGGTSQSENCPSNTACAASGTQCSSTDYCNTAWRCCSGSGAGKYPSTGDYSCQGKCDGSNNCNYANNCDYCLGDIPIRYCDSGSGFCARGTLIINSIEIKPIVMGNTVNPVAGKNLLMNVTVNITNSTYMAPVNNCSVRIFNSTMSYSNPVKGPYNGTIQKSNLQWQCFQNWNMEYWRNPDTWNVSVNMSLWTGLSNFTSTNFTYNNISAWNDNITTNAINWTGLPGQKNVNSLNAYPMFVNNTGNMRLNISINGTDFIYSGYVIGVGNASFSNTTPPSTFYNITRTPELMIKLDVLNVSNIFFRINIPLGFINQTYTSNIDFNSSYI
jgi:hypothetical protein